MDDFDEADEMNEEDLLEINDEFAKINLKVRSVRQRQFIQEIIPFC